MRTKKLIKVESRRKNMGTFVEIIGHAVVEIIAELIRQKKEK